MNQLPTLGRIVRYVLPSGPNAGQPRAAIITNVTPAGVALTCFPDAARDSIGVTYSAMAAQEDADGKKLGTWHWPPRDFFSMPAEDSPAALFEAIRDNPQTVFGSQGCETIIVPQNEA